MNIVKNALVVTFIMASTTAHADAWNCRQDNLVREVAIEYPDGGSLPCRVVYRKQSEGSEDKELWSAVNQEGYCAEKASAFAAKLEGWGWTCVETTSGQ